MPERARQLSEQHRVAAAERLQVGAVGERHVDPHEHVAGAGLGPRHLFQPQVAGAMEEESPHGVKTTLSAWPERYSSTPSVKRSNGSTVGSGTSSSGRRAAASSMCRGVAERDPVSVSSRR